LSNIECFLFEHQGVIRRSLRRFSLAYDCTARPGLPRYHDAKVWLEDKPRVWEEIKLPKGITPDEIEAFRARWQAMIKTHGTDSAAEAVSPDSEYIRWQRDNPHKRPPEWPEHCTCGYCFSETDHRQIFNDPLYTCEATAVTVPYSELPVGAMWHAGGSYWEDAWRGPDGKILHVKTPGGPWNIDSRASNCTLPDDNEHRCWVRHGDAPRVTVDKAGLTCGAGAGSILAGDYHGFLQNGFLVGA
jgi:hypothetical protein